MKTTSRLCAVLALLAVVAPLRAENPTNFTAESASEGSKFTLTEHRGKIIALHFLLKTECPFCLRLTHDYAALAAATPNVVHLFLKPDSMAEIKKWSAKISADDLPNLPTIHRDADATLAEAYGIPAGYQFHGQTVHFPALVVLNADGKELFRYIGKKNSDRLQAKDFAARLSEALK